MIELVRSDDPVFLSWLRTRLAEEGIEVVVFDEFTSSAYAHALGLVRCRVMIDAADRDRAAGIIAGCGAVPIDG
jgi:hypothetical protein